MCINHTTNGTSAKSWELVKLRRCFRLMMSKLRNYLFIKHFGSLSRRLTYFCASFRRTFLSISVKRVDFILAYDERRLNAARNVWVSCECDNNKLKLAFERLIKNDELNIFIWLPREFPEDRKSFSQTLLSILSKRSWTHRFVDMSMTNLSLLVCEMWQI